MSRGRWVLTIAAVLAGCGSSDLDDAETVRTWATSGSAVAVYATIHDAVAFADGQTPFDDPACPTTSDDGTTATITGACVDSSGTEWTGTATVERSAEGDRSVVLEGWGSFDDPDFAAQTSGTGVVRSTDETTHAFEVDVEREGGLTTTIDYAGTIMGTYDQATTWNGSGIVTRDGLVSPTGTVRVETVDEVMDDGVCQNQPASGETTVEEDGETAFIRYDGATDCDPDRAAVWGFDGEDRGTVNGVDCSAAGAPATSSAPIVALLLAALGGTARRRRG